MIGCAVLFVNLFRSFRTILRNIFIQIKINLHSKEFNENDYLIYPPPCGEIAASPVQIKDIEVIEDQHRLLLPPQENKQIPQHSIFRTKGVGGQKKKVKHERIHGQEALGHDVGHVDEERAAHERVADEGLGRRRLGDARRLGGLSGWKMGGTPMRRIVTGPPLKCRGWSSASISDGEGGGT